MDINDSEAYLIPSIPSTLTARCPPLLASSFAIVSRPRVPDDGDSDGEAVRVIKTQAPPLPLSLSPASLFIAEHVQMSMIFADICKRCCHINNCLTKMFKMEKEKTAHRGKCTEASA